MEAGEPRGSTATAWLRRRWRWLVAAAVALVALVCLAVAVSWHFSSAVLVPDYSGWPEDVTVEGVAGNRISLSRSEDTERPGVYGLDWQAGHAIVGDVLRADDETVTRRLRAVRGYLASGMEVAIDPQVYTPDPGALGLPFTTVQVRGELGEMPAWKVAGRADTWAIVVHGINSTPQTGLRLLPALSHSGMPTLLITYREDLGAPASPDGLRHMGQTEWRDLQAAVRYALSHGAEHVVLAGYSMGGSIVAQFMQNSELASPQVVGLVLDAPALDWRKTIKFNATEMGSPAFSTLSVEWAIGARIDVDWNDLDAAGHPEDFQLPILLFHGTEDDIVPISISNEFAEELPRRVTYYRIPHADHTEAWNVDPELYERRLEAFLLKLDASDPVSRRRGGQSGGPR